MFEVKQVGRKIALRRKEKNMTQMELADAMGVSFQAVSNWERGNSMPDIGKLPELSAVLDLSIDDLLTNGEPAKLVQHILDGDAEAYIRAESVKADTVAQVAPLLRPQQAENILENVLAQDPPDDLLEDLSQVAPFVSEGFLHGWAMQVASIADIRDLTAIAPFLSGETLDQLVDKLTDSQKNISAILPLAPFLSHATLDALAQQCVNDMQFSQLHSLAPFVSSGTLDKIAGELSENGDVTLRELVSLAPFLSDTTLQQLAETLSGDALNIKAILPLAPFLPEAALNDLAQRAANDASLSDLAGLAPFVSSGVLDALATGMVDAGQVALKDITALAPFLSSAALGTLCEQAMEDADPKQVAALAPFLPTQTLHACAERLIAQYGLKGIRDLAPFL